MKNYKIYIFLMIFCLKNQQSFSLKKNLLYSTLVLYTASLWAIGKYGNYNFLRKNNIFNIIHINNFTFNISNLIEKYNNNLIKENDIMELKSKTKNTIAFFLRENFAYIVSGWRDANKKNLNFLNKKLNELQRSISFNKLNKKNNNFNIILKLLILALKEQSEFLKDKFKNLALKILPYKIVTLKSKDDKTQNSTNIIKQVFPDYSYPHAFTNIQNTNASNQNNEAKNLTDEQIKEELYNIEDLIEIEYAKN